MELRTQSIEEVYAPIEVVHVASRKEHAHPNRDCGMPYSNGFADLCLRGGCVWGEGAKLGWAVLGSFK